MRPYLVFVRAGSKSLHPRLLREDPQRNWDCWASWYSAPSADSGADRNLSGGFNKFEALALALDEWRRPWPYRYVLVLDDDIEFQPGDISRYFELCDRHSLFLSQPALTWRSYFSIRITLRHAFTRLRRVSFVEVMAPCMSAAALEFLRSTFRLTRSTWGIDLAWTAACRDRYPVHVVDDVTMTHTKPIDRRSGAFYQVLRDAGVDAGAELDAVYFAHSGQDLSIANLRRGHVWRGPMPRLLAPLALQAGEAFKIIAKVSQSLRKRRWRRAQRKLQARTDGHQTQPTPST